MKIQNRLKQLKEKQAIAIVIGLCAKSYQLAQRLSQDFETYAADPLVDESYGIKIGGHKNQDINNLTRPDATVFYLSGRSEFISNWEDLKAYAQMVGKNLNRGDWVIFGEQIDPDVVEVVLLPIIESFSGLRLGLNFEIAFDPQIQNAGTLKNLGFELRVSHNLIVDPVAEILSCSRENFKSFQINFLDEPRQLSIIRHIVAEDWVPVLNQMDAETFGELYQACIHDQFLAPYKNLKLKNELRPNPQRFFQFAWECGLKHEGIQADQLKEAV